MIRIAVDIFGGDNAPGAIVEGCVKALSEHDDFELLLTGDREKIEQELKPYSYDASRVTIVHAPEVIGCHEAPSAAVKCKKESSLVKAMQLVADREADCVVSAGSSGAVLAGGILILRRLKGVKRPAFAAVLPTAKGKLLLLDSGANTDSKPQYLQQFAIMGSAYMQGVLHVESPRVGLLNNGAEAEKGNELTKAAYVLLQRTPVNFVGNCEAREIVSGDYDVLVCDGFDGNVVLKFMEGLASTMMGMLKGELLSDFRGKLGALIAKPAFRRFKKKMDYSEFGGAPLLGVDGGVIKAHGSSNAKAIASAINQARSLVSGGIVEIIKNGVLEAEALEAEREDAAPEA